MSNYTNVAYLVPQSVKIHSFCSDPISVDPICPQPKPGLRCSKVAPAWDEEQVKMAVPPQVIM